MALSETAVQVTMLDARSTHGYGGGVNSQLLTVGQCDTAQTLPAASSPGCWSSVRPGHRGAYAGCVVRRQPGTADATVGGTEDLDEPAQAAGPGADCVRSMVPWCGGSQLASWAESPWGTDVIVAAPGLSLSCRPSVCTASSRGSETAPSGAQETTCVATERDGFTCRLKI